MIAEAADYKLILIFFTFLKSSLIEERQEAAMLKAEGRKRYKPCPLWAKK